MIDASALYDPDEEHIEALAQKLYEASGGQCWRRVSDHARQRWRKQAYYVDAHIHEQVQPLRDVLLDTIEGLIPAAAKGASQCRGGDRARAEAAIQRGKEYLR